MSSMSKTEILKHFKDNLILFVNALVTKFPEEGDIWLLSVVVNEANDVDEIIRVFGKIVLPHAEMVHNKNDNFFLEKCSTLLKGIVPDSVELNHFKKIYLSPSFTDDDKQQLWRWFKLFLVLTQKYLDA
jgi:hypothetical protein